MVDFLMASHFSTEKDEEGPISSRADAMRVGQMMMSRRNFFRAEFGEKKVKKRDGTIKTKKTVIPIQGPVHAYSPEAFVDEDVPFVWTYDPVTKKTLMYGLMLLAGVCACAAIPLWPNWLRNSVLAFLLFFLIGRPGIWLFVYLITFSRWNFSILPNMDLDVSFEKRFSPLWVLERSETASGNGDDEDEDEGDAEGDGDEDGDNDEEGDGDEDGDGDDSK